MKDKVAVIDMGSMGSEIAQVAAEGNFVVQIVDASEDILSRRLANIKNFIARKVTKGSLTPAQEDEIGSPLLVTTDLDEAVKDAVMVVEAVLEKAELKQRIFKKWDDLIYNKSCNMIHNGIATAEAFDQAMKLGCN